MPIYMLCPHCDHPQIVPKERRGKKRLCRQCGQPYQTFKHSPLVHPAADSVEAAGSYVTGSGQRVFVLE